MPKKTAPPSGSPDSQARAVAEAVEHAWHRAHGHGRLEVPASVVAGLALLGPPPEQRAAVADHISALNVEEFAGFMRGQWACFIGLRPDLANPVWPLAEVWHGEHPITGPALEAAPAVARAALAAGQLHLTGGRHTRWEIDLLGVLLTTMRGPTSASARGQYYTPGHVAESMAALLLTGIKPGKTVYEPTVGTGGMLRAAAQVMRSRGIDPASMVWAATDVDPLALACAAVNAALWELGNNVLLTVSDGLAEPAEQAIERARAQRAETLGLARRLHEYREVVTAFHGARRLLDELTATSSDDGAADDGEEAGE